MEKQAFVETLYRRAIAIREAVHGPNSPQLAATLSNLVSFITNSIDPLTSDHIDEAENLLKRGLKIRTHVFGDKHCDVASSNHLLGNLYQYQRKEYDQAERYYDEALKVRDAYYTRQSDRAGQTLMGMAHLARAKGNMDVAEKRFVEALAIREVVHASDGQTHNDVIKTADALASLYRQQGKREEYTRLHGKIGEWRKRNTTNTENSNHHLRRKVLFPLTVGQIPEGFHLKSKILGPKGVHLKHIEQQSGAERVFLRLGTEPEPAAAALPAAAPAEETTGFPPPSPPPGLPLLQRPQGVHGRGRRQADHVGRGGGGAGARLGATDALGARPTARHLQGGLLLHAVRRLRRAHPPALAPLLALAARRPARPGDARRLQALGSHARALLGLSAGRAR